jgi:hypothetical protein
VKRPVSGEGRDQGERILTCKIVRLSAMFPGMPTLSMSKENIYHQMDMDEACRNFAKSGCSPRSAAMHWLNDRASFHYEANEMARRRG